MDDLLDALLDLKHDLGKYIYLPLAFLPEPATQAQLRDALTTALVRTRVTPQGIRSAQDIWEAFIRESGECAGTLQSFDHLRAIVSQALSWSEKLADSDLDLDSNALRKDLSRVSEAISQVIEEVQHG
jgi:hypothetical protein